MSKVEELIESLKARVMSMTKRVGVAQKDGNKDKAAMYRRKRYGYMTALAMSHGVYTVINPEGKTEFLDKAEFEHRMIAWARRNGVIPRAAIADGAQPESPQPEPEGEQPKTGE